MRNLDYWAKARLSKPKLIKIKRRKSYEVRVGWKARTFVLLDKKQQAQLKANNKKIDELLKKQKLILREKQWKTLN